MRILKFIGIFALMIMSFSSCDEILGRLFAQPEPDSVQYLLDLSFQDVSGNDLVKGVGLEWWLNSTFIPVEQAQSGIVRSDVYELSVIFSNPCSDGDSFITEFDSTWLGMEMYENGYYYLTTDYRFTVGNCPAMKMLTYKLKCPYVFGDEAVHELVTYWDIPKMHSGFAYPTCNRIEFEGKVITPMTYKDQMQKYVYISYATIILESRETQ